MVESYDEWAKLNHPMGLRMDVALSPLPEYRSVAIDPETGQGIALTWDDEVVPVEMAGKLM